MSVASENGPLAGCRVLELGSIVAGPFCGRLLADFGAEVIKVEPAEGDGIRSAGKRFKGKSLYAASILRNKSLISIDLRTPEGQNIIKRMVPGIDIVIENFRPGGLEKWGLGYADLARLNPGLIMVRISGFGQSGPLSMQPGYGVIAEAMSGLRHITGDPDRPPARVGVALTDYITGLYAAFGAMLALHHRTRTGEGQCVDAALYEGAFSLMERFVPAFEKLGVDAQRTGSALADTAPNNLYPTQDEKYIHICSSFDAVFKRLVAAMGQPALMTDARFNTAINRGANAQALDEIVGAWTRAHPLAEIEQKLTAAGVPASRIFSMVDVFRDAHYRARDMLVDVPDDEFGTIKLAGTVPKLTRTPGKLRRSGGRIGRDTRKVLSELGGFTAAEFAALEKAGVIYCDTQTAAGATAKQEKKHD